MALLPGAINSNVSNHEVFLSPFIYEFKRYLTTQRVQPKKVTIKNYVADIRQFIVWFEKFKGISFDPFLLTPETFAHYKTESSLSKRTLERHISSMRKFSAFLLEKGYIESNPIPIHPKRVISEDHWKIQAFKDYLYSQKSSYLTIKNYINDILSYRNWLTEFVRADNNSYIIENLAPSSIVSAESINEYKYRLLHVLKLSPKSVNRKLSALRKYISFLDYEDAKGIRGIENVSELPPPLHLDQIQKENTERVYSSLPPVRLIQKLTSPYFQLEDRLAEIIVSSVKMNRVRAVASEGRLKKQVRNIPKEFYAPRSISLQGTSLQKKLFHHLKHARPKWYNIYHNYSFSSYLHAAILVIYATGVSLFIYNSLFPKSSEKNILFAAERSPGKTIVFNGRILNAQQAPITTPSDIRFNIYNSGTASGSALLWQETHQNVTPNKDGIFSAVLGIYKPLASSLFSQNSQLFLGLTVGTGPELLPRQRLANTGLASTAETLLGMKPITHSNASANVLLALDSAGNLSMYGASDHLFQVIGGQLALSAEDLLLTSNTGSNGNVILAPDGSGVIDIQKSLVNTTNDGSLAPGAVNIDDRLAVNATESGVAVFMINNSLEGGDLFTASTAGTTRFVIKTSGFVGINTPNPAASLDINGSASISGTLSLNGSTYTFPYTKGAPGQVLANDGSGILSWVDQQSQEKFFTRNNGSVSLASSSDDLLIGANSTPSATFAFLNMNSSSPFARFNGKLVFDGASADARIIAAANGKTFTIGDSNTGNVSLAPAGVPLLSATSTGKVGIGNTNPEFKFQVTDSQAATVSALIYNSNSGADADGLAIKLGFTNSGSSSNRFVSFLNGNGLILGSIASNASGGIAYSTSGSDFAEYFRKEDASEDLPPGTLVCFGTQGGVTACDFTHSKIVGVISDRAGFIGGENHAGDARFALVALMGQVEVKVQEQDTIYASDAITISKQKGAAGKIIGAGFIVGRALEPHASLSKKDSILVALQPTFYNPDYAVNGTGQLVSKIDQLASESTLIKQNITNEDSLFSSLNRAVGIATDEVISNSLGVFHTVRANMFSAEHAAVGSLNVLTDALTIQGTSLKEYILNTIAASPIAGEKIVSPLASVDKIETQIISPLGGKGPSLSFNENSLNVLSSPSGSLVGRWDSKGNAILSGSLTANEASISGTTTNSSLIVQNDAQVAGNATVSGTLHAGKIIASEIDGLDEKIKKLKDSYSNNDTQAPATPTNTSDDLLAVTPEMFSKAKPVNNLQTSFDFLKVDQNLLSLGTASLREASIFDKLSVGQTLTFSNNSVNTIYGDLEIENMRQGLVSFMGGLVKISQTGDLLVKGTAEFAKDVTIRGTLAASVISPLPGAKLAIHIGNQNTSRFSLINKDNQEVATINQNGDITASGSATFSKLNIFASPVYARGDTEYVATGSAGTATLLPYKSEVTILNQNVTAKSLIYITPATDTQNTVLYLLRQVPNASFTVGVSKVLAMPIQFNWIIVN